MQCNPLPLELHDSSVLFRQGNTQIQVTLNGPLDRTVGSMSVLHDDSQQCALIVHFSIAPFASADRRNNASSKASRSQIAEYSSLIQQSLQSLMHSQLYVGSRIDLNIQVLTMDGCPLGAALTAASAALVLAGIPMQDTVAAVSVAIFNQSLQHKTNAAADAAAAEFTCLVDVNSIERNNALTTPMTYGCTSIVPAVVCSHWSGGLLHCNSAQQTRDCMQLSMQAAQKACEELQQIVETSIREYTINMAQRAGTHR